MRVGGLVIDTLVVESRALGAQRQEGMGRGGVDLVSPLPGRLSVGLFVSAGLGAKPAPQHSTGSRVSGHPEQSHQRACSAAHQRAGTAGSERTPAMQWRASSLSIE
jgi:hypothetical protein